MTIILRARRRARVLKTMVATAAILSALTAAMPAGAEPTFGGVKYLAAVAGSNLVTKPPFGAISCPTTSWCVAVGDNFNANINGGAKASVITFSSGAWGIPSAISLPSNATSTTDFSPGLFGVSCWAAGDCVAVGQYAAVQTFDTVQTTIEEPMVAVETAGTWSQAQEVTLPITSSTAGFAMSVSCSASGDCTLVGTYIVIHFVPSTTAVTKTFISTETGGSGTWSTATDGISLGGGSVSVIPLSISCIDANDCTYVFITDHDLSYAVSEHSGIWDAPVRLAAAAGKVWNANSVRCWSVGNCLAVGTDSTTATKLDNNQSLVPAFAIEHSGIWNTAGQLPQPLLSPVANGGMLFGLSCATGPVCEAVGAGTLAPSGLYSIPEAYTFSAGKWSSGNFYGAPIMAGPVKGTAPVFLDVACASASRCRTVGATSLGTINSTNYNEYSFSTALNPTMPIGAPGAPSGLHVVLAPTTATAAWRPPGSDGGTKVLYFTVTATSAHLPTRQCVSTGLSCKVTGLSKGHAYRMSVTDRTAHGTSGPSPAIIFIAH
jgi:hypothetical protein